MIAVWVLLQDGAPPVHGVPLSAWLASAASGLFCTAGSTLLWNWGIHHVPASRAAVFLNIEPMLGSFLGVELLGDRLGPLAWIGGVLILVSSCASSPPRSASAVHAVMLARARASASPRLARTSSRRKATSRSRQAGISA